jgi:O-acetylserine/cysteine efflux transporter
MQAHMQARLRPVDALVLVLVTFIWGSNFVVIRVGLQGFDPMLLAVIRFVASAFPLVWLLPKPAVATRWLVLNGLFVGAGQFGLLFIALKSDISPGLASLLMQTQVFSTILLAAGLLHEAVRPRQWAGLAVGAAGLATVAWHLDAHNITPLGLALVLCAASFWAASNILTKAMSQRAGAPLPMLPFVVWSSLYAIPPLLALVLVTPGLHTVVQQLGSAQWSHWAAALWQALGNTLIGYVAWSALLARHPASVVTPWALLVPVFGMSSAAWLLGEPLPGWKLLAAALVVAGIAITTWPAAARPLPAAARRKEEPA